MLSHLPHRPDRRLSNFFQCAPGLFFTLRREADGRMSMPFVGGRLELLQGIAPDLLAKDIGPLLALCVPDDVRQLMVELDRSAQEMTPCRAEVRIERGARRKAVVELSGMPERAEGEPGVVEWDGFLHDVTAQREETRLRKQIQSVARAVPGFLYTTHIDANGISTFPFVSDGIEALCGLRPSDIRDDATALRARYHPDDVPGLFEQIEEACKTLKPFRYEARIFHPEQGMRWIEIRSTLHRLPNGGVEAHGLILDVTDRKSTEAALEKQYGEALRLNQLLDENARNLEEHAVELEATHEQLKATEAWYREVIHSAPDGMIVIDQRGIIILVNDELQRKFGYAEHELIGQSIDLLVPPPVRKGHGEKRVAFTRGALRERKAHAIPNLRACRRDGSEFDVDVTLSALPENEFNDEAICVAIRDVSERRLTEERLRQALNFSEGIINAIPDLLLEMDRNGLYLNVWTSNPAIQEAQKAALIGKRLYDIVGQEAGDKAMAALREADEKGNAFGHTICIVQPDGERRWYDHSVSKKRGATPDQDTFIALSRDVTARVRAESALSASEARARERSDLLNAVMDSSPDVIVFALDRNYRYLTFNRQHLDTMRAIWGKEIQVGMNMLDVIGTQEDREKSRRSFDRVLADETFFEEETYGDEALSRKHWQIFWSPIRSESGEVSGLTCIVMDNSERKETELRLAETYQRLHSVLTTIPDLVWLKNTEGVYLACNHAFEKFFGAEEREIVGKTDYDFIDKELADFFREKDIAAIEAGQVCINEEWVTYAATGERGLLETRKVPVFGEDGAIIGVLGVARDITERKRMEDELRRREQYQRTLLDNFPFLVWLKDEESRLLAANVEFARAVGAASPIELEGKSDFELFPRALAEQYVIDDREVMDSGVPKHLEEPFVDAHGNHLWIETWKSPLIVDGKTLGTVGFFRDITKRKEIDLRLEETRWLLHSVLQGIPDPVWMKDANGVFLVCNPGVGRLFNVPVEDIIGKTDHDFFDPELAEFYQQKDRTAMEAGHVRLNEEWWTFGDNGERVLMETRKAPVKSLDGKFLGVLGVARDITERKSIQETLAMREREFRTLVENTPDTVARFGPDLRRKFANPALAKFLGKTADELLGQKTSEFPGGLSGTLAEEKLKEVFNAGHPLEFEYIWHDKSGNEICSLMRMAPEFDDKGEVKSVLAVGRDITELNTFRQKIHQMAFYDTLTGLPNRALFNDRLSQMITDASWHGQSAGVMMIDMDRFKAVNDTMGHAVGDELLCEAARRLMECVRSYDTVARLGGDEFAVILPDIRTGADLGRIASKMLEKFDERFLLDGKDIFVSCSIGIALYPDDSSDGQDLLKFADSAMYYAKRSGRNNFRFYAKDLTATAQARLTLEQDLRQAISRGELELHYQPKISLNDGKIIGSEALLRWRHPQQGMIPPMNFIQIAEDTGLIVDIGQWVLREACRVAAAWNGNGQDEHKLAINLSPRQFQSPHLIESVRRALEESACRPEWIELEITESLLLDEDGQVLDILNTFRDMGISIAIDDFGTGYSALSYLARFPIDTLKIDRSFINAVTTDHYRAELVRAILSIARCLGQVVVAEGVETVDQASFLAAHGCQIAQGFLYSKAVPEAEFALLPRRFTSTS